MDSEREERETSEEEAKFDFDAAEQKLAVLQQAIKEAKIPVIALFEGWGASGKGYIIGHLIQNFDPRSFKVYTIGERTADERRFPAMHRYFNKIPQYGRISVFDRSWYRDVSIERVEEKMTKPELDRRFKEILDFESQLSDDGYVILKFFLIISKEEQKKRFRKLESDPATAWRVSEEDWKHHRDYDKYLHAFTEMIDRTDRPYAPWLRLDAENRKHALALVYERVIEAMEVALEKKRMKLPPSPDALRIRTDARILPRPIPKLAEIDLNRRCDPDLYKVELRKAQKRLFELHNLLYRTRRPLIIVYEGWDAAGKGGNIKRLTRGLDPRGYEVIPVAAPTTEEIQHQYLWRFWKSLPKDGHIAIYDRSWYVRVMVERIEGFCTEIEWKRAFAEMNSFEESLHQWGAIIIKFWLHIDRNEQLRRFEERQNTPEKQWKITDEDWRNREKWDAYETSVDEMLHYTNTAYAPWVIIESNDKKFARIRAINAVIDHIESELAADGE